MEFNGVLLNYRQNPEQVINTNLGGTTNYNIYYIDPMSGKETPMGSGTEHNLKDTTAKILEVIRNDTEEFDFTEPIGMFVKFNAEKNERRITDEVIKGADNHVNILTEAVQENKNFEGFVGDYNHAANRVGHYRDEYGKVQPRVDDNSKHGSLDWQPDNPWVDNTTMLPERRDRLEMLNRINEIEGSPTSSIDDIIRDSQKMFGSTEKTLNPDDKIRGAMGDNTFMTENPFLNKQELQSDDKPWLRGFNTNNGGDKDMGRYEFN